MTIEEYRKQFINDLRIDAEHEGTDPETQFINKSLEQLEDIGELNDPMPMSIEIRGRRGRIMSFDAYAYDEADGALCLITSDFSNELDNVETLTNGRIDDIVAHMQNFIDAIRENKEPIAPVDYGTSTNTLCCLTNIARELKRPVHWNPALLSFEGDKEAAAHRLYWYEYRRPYKLRYVDFRFNKKA